MASICTEGNRHNDDTEPTWGDWLNIDSPTPNRVIGRAYRAYDARLMQEMAEALGETDDAAFFAEEAECSRALFRDELFDGDAVAVKTQTAAALAIVMELVEGEDLEAARWMNSPCRNHRDKTQFQLNSTGAYFFGLCRCLEAEATL